ncbi:MAG: hypothetical protein ACYDEA_02980 [Candidatus Dormibacteria bacterium]
MVPKALAVVVAAAATSVGGLVLAGCGTSAPTPVVNSRAMAAKLVSAANTSAFGTSFQATFKAGVNVTISGVNGLPAPSLQHLTRVQQQLNAYPLGGTVDFQSPTEFRITWSLPGFLPAPLQVIEVGGSAYASLDGSHWYLMGAPPPGSGPGWQLPFHAANLPSELKSLGTPARGVTVRNMGTESRDGIQVDQFRVVVSGAGLAQILSGAAGALDSGASPATGAEIAGLSQILQFDQATGEIYIATKTHLPQQESLSGSTSINLGALGLLVPGQTPAPQGTIGVSLNLAVDYGRYGASFSIQKPTDILPGPLPLPSSLSQAS